MAFGALPAGGLAFTPATLFGAALTGRGRAALGTYTQALRDLLGGL